MINEHLSNVDNEISQVITREQRRQEDCIELIASENFTSTAVMEAQGSVLTNKYAEGLPGKRYYCGCEEVDKAENIARIRAQKLFNCLHANVQPHSGSQANQAVYFALLKPQDTILSMSLDCGGHLTHGAAPNQSGQLFNPVFYGVDKKTHYINFDELEKLALIHHPKLIIAGFSSYTRELDFKNFRRIADKVGAYLMADIAHISGLIAAGLHPNPFPYAHVATSTTHKTLRGPRGGMILSNTPELSKLIDKAVFPGLQGGPLMHVIAAKAVAFKEALSDQYRQYIKQVLKNACILGETLQSRGYDILTHGTTNHMVVLDLRKYGITGKLASESLRRAGITSNKNTVPFDPNSPCITSGVRFGTAACTTRGFQEQEFISTGHLIASILDSLQKTTKNHNTEEEIYVRVKEITSQFPIYSKHH